VASFHCRPSTFRLGNEVATTNNDGSPAQQPRSRCCTRDEARKIPRDLHEDARDVARRKMKTKAFARSRDERKRVEMRFAHLKTHHGFERLRLRGLSGARDEFHLAAIVQNLKTLALRLVWPPPDLAAASVA